MDFKRLNDKDSIRKYRDDMRSTDFGLMGRSRIPYAYESCGFGNRRSLQIHAGFKVAEPPNPRYSETQRFYEKYKKPFKAQSPVGNKRVAQLEDPTWNEKVFTGEHMGHLTWYHSQISSPKDAIGAATDSASGTTRAKPPGTDFCFVPL